MKKLVIVFIAFLFSLSCAIDTKKEIDYEGTFCSGNGDTDYLRLIDESFAFFNPTATVPNLSMVYQPDWNTFAEGAGWGAWWIQNSYGFSLASTPFLQEPWFSLLQNSWDLFWDNQGDGKRMSMWGGSPTANRHSPLIAPDGCLGDAAAPGQIAFKQGDGDLNIHDWFYEATAAGVVMQTEILLASRDMDAISHYMPKMERACDFIERIRDSKNDLLLVGPACNLLAPSYGGVKQPDGSFGKGYLSGLSITYLGALDRMIELYKIIDDKGKLSEYMHRQRITRESLPQLLTSEGYFAKSVEPGGLMHGVPGQEKYNYLEGVANADAVALRVADASTAENIYNAIESCPDIRPFDFLLTNAPGLDDTYWNWGNRTGEGMGGIHQFGSWVNGGVWGTVEGRAILMYYRLGKFDDIRRSASRAMKWAKDFRMDAPWSQRGENTHNVWSDTGRNSVKGVAVMIDNFAIPAATIRGLFDYEYLSDRLIIRPRIPGSITQYTQNQPVRFGHKKLYFSCNNGGPEVISATVNGKSIEINSKDELALYYYDLPEIADITITTGGGWPETGQAVDYPKVPSLESGQGSGTIVPVELVDSLKMPFAVLSEMQEVLADESDADYELSFVNAAIESFEACRLRPAMDPGEGYFRAITPERKEGIIDFYNNTAAIMYKGLENLMTKYAEGSDANKKRIAELFKSAQDNNK